ncbi:MAG: glycoside hydrolase family 127 protein [Lachnospiraceae bacterium]|nr:glycoside hydrolase family 127 protein [Lachnospiraceae bacterium]
MNKNQPKPSEYSCSSPLSLRDVQITDPFWKHEMELVRTEVIPYQWAALNDQVEGAAPSYCMRNFRIAGKLNREKVEKGSAFEEPKYTFRGFEALPDDPEHPDENAFYGFVFQDSDFFKWIEAVGYSLAQHTDPELEAIADGAIGVVCAAQQEDGYLDTYYIINGRDAAFSNLRDHHELYCFGHLIEGAVAYYQATGKDKLLKAAQRYADYVANTFGPEDGKCKGYPGHEIAEMALVRLYEVTGEQKYLDLSRFFIDQRGTRPYYFDQEHPEVVKPGHEAEPRHAYHQADRPVREQSEAVGHAVRAVYLYSGMADVARHTRDEELYRACERLWDDIVERKMYITGGIGSTHLGEAFTYAYDLPNDTAYAETCASIGLVFFARRMLEIRPQAKYADVMECALYNGILSGMALDGKSFFYVNPLEVYPEACKKDERKFHVKPVRQKWFGCACCPPNLARLLSSIASYAYTETKDTLFVHLYIGGEIMKNISVTTGIGDIPAKNLSAAARTGDGFTEKASAMTETGDDEGVKAPDYGESDSRNGSRTDCCSGESWDFGGTRNSAVTDSQDNENCKNANCQTVKVSIFSDLPWDGRVKIRVQAKGTPFRLALRIPEWVYDEDFCVSADTPAEQICARIHISGIQNARVWLRDGYLYLSKDWGEDDVFELHFPMGIRLMAADPRVREDIGKAAVMRGPLVYCVEEADNGRDLHLLALNPDAVPEISDIEICGNPAKEIAWPGFRQVSYESSFRADLPTKMARPLYRPWKKPEYEPTILKFIPYYMWANRSQEPGGAEMQVWIHMRGWI